MPEFVHLHVHSDYSFLDGACRITVDKEVKKQVKPAPPLTLPEHAARLGFKALALTDHGMMFGAVDFYKACRAKGVRPILGCEIYVSERAAGTVRRHEADREFHLILLAKDAEGYNNLIKLVSLGCLQTEAGNPRVDRSQVAQFARGLVATSACVRGEVGQRFFAGDEAGALDVIGAYRDMFAPGDFYLEMNDQSLDGQAAYNRFLVAAAKRTGVPLVAANDVHYLRREDAEMQDILMCLKAGETQESERRQGMGSQEFYLKSADEMAALFGEVPEALAATVEIAEKCRVELALGGSHYPAYAPPTDETPGAYLSRLAHEGLDRRYPRAAEEERAALVKRLDYELGVLEAQGFTSYLLIVWDFIHYAKTNGIAVGPGRGSAAGSLAAYALAITDVDPIRYGLLFERFQNPERKSAPDIDVDFDPQGRERVINYVRKKYGEPCVAQIATFGTLGAKAAVRDVVRVLGLPFSEGDRIAKLIPVMPGMTIDRALGGVEYQDEKETKDAKRFHGPDFQKAYEAEDTVRRVVDLARQVEGLCRQAGIHAAGVVIASEPLGDVVPLARAAAGEVITQFDMNTVAELGLLKMDFLGLKTLTVIEEAFRLIERTTGRRLTRDEIPLDDAKAIRLFQEARTVGLFQFESAGMRRLLKDFVPESIDHLIALNALFRPGPMDLAPSFCARRHGREKITYDHPLLEQVCADTFGIMIYQEQVMSAASLLAGYSLGEADLLRRAMGKKDKSQMAQERAKFVAGCAKTNQIAKAKADKIFDLLEDFAGYGFNKSHSAAYAVVAMQTGWLKANHPAEFMAGLMTNDIGKTDALAVFAAECRAMGVGLLGPDVNRSEARFSVESGAVRYGLAGVKGVGEAAVELVVSERMKGGPFKDLDDLCHRVDPAQIGRRTLENLARTGAFDSIDPNRRRVFESVGPAMDAASAYHSDKRRGQASLFGEEPMLHDRPRRTSAEVTEDWPLTERINYERDLLGVYLSAHPLDGHGELLAQIDTRTIAEMETLREGEVIRVAALITGVEQRFTKHKQPMGRGMLEDRTGQVPLFLAPAEYERCGSLLRERQVALVAGYLEEDSRGRQAPAGEGEQVVERQATFRVLEIVPMDQAVTRFGSEVVAELAPGGASLDELDRLLRGHAGSCAVRFHVPWRGRMAEVVPDAHFFVAPTGEFLERLRALPGVVRVRPTVARNPPLPQRVERRGRNGQGFAREE
jgi:DNA polymerase-3 subunit alpha